MHHHGAVTASFNTPAAAVALVFVNYDVTCFKRLRKRIAGASSDARWVLAFSACERQVFSLLGSYDSDAGFNCVKGFFVAVAAGVLAGLAANAFVCVNRDESSVMKRYQCFSSPLRIVLNLTL
jgi:hypothetical protein